MADPSHHTTAGIDVSYGITQCYLPPGRGDIPAFTQAEAGTWFSDRGRTQGWVELVGWWPWRDARLTWAGYVQEFNNSWNGRLWN